MFGQEYLPRSNLCLGLVPIHLKPTKVVSSFMEGRWKHSLRGGKLLTALNPRICDGGTYSLRPRLRLGGPHVSAPEPLNIKVLLTITSYSCNIRWLRWTTIAYPRVEYRSLPWHKLLGS